MDLFDDPNLTFSKLSAAWLLSLDPRMRIGAFTRTLCDAVSRAGSQLDGSELSDLLRQHRVIPDAYLIDGEQGLVYLFEIEDTNPLSADKLRKLSEIWFRLDSIGWEMRVFLVDRYMSCWRSLPLSDVWHTLESPMPNSACGTDPITIDWEATHNEASRIAINAPIRQAKSVA